MGSQSELIDCLAERGYRSTQATLSRDLRDLHVTKAATNDGGYMYILPPAGELQDSFITNGRHSITKDHVGFVSIEFSGNFAVIKTRNGYATGLAYDIDMSKSQEIIGTIAGADTVFAILREGVTREQAMKVFERFIPIDRQG